MNRGYMVPTSARWRRFVLQVPSFCEKTEPLGYDRPGNLCSAFPGTCGQCCDFFTVKWEGKCLYQKVVWHAPVLWEQGQALLTPFVNGDINVSLCRDKTSWADKMCSST